MDTLRNFFIKIKGNAPFRIKLFLCASFLCNVLYSIFLFVVGRLYISNWFLVMSIYYALLSIVRSVCIFQVYSRKQELPKIKAMQACGVFLLLIDLVVATMMFILMHGDKAVQHHEITVIALAAYTFSALTIAIYNYVKYMRKREYIFSCIKAISLTAASVSLVNLTTTMLHTWGRQNEALKSVILPILSAFVSIFIIVCAILMIRKTNLDIRTLKYGKEGK